MADKKITVLIALHEATDYIESKLASLRLQTMIDDAEVIFLVNNNDQQVYEACERYATEYKNSRVKLFKDHVSLYHSWNVGIKESNSIYITNYNADDQWHPQFIEKCCDYLDNNQSVAMLSTGILITEIPCQIWPDWKFRDIMPKYPYPLSTAGPCPVWRRDLHSRYGYFGDYKVIGDARFWEKLLVGGEKFDIIDENLVLYYASSKSLERRRDVETGLLLREMDLEMQDIA